VSQLGEQADVRAKPRLFSRLLSLKKLFGRHRKRAAETADVDHVSSDILPVPVSVKLTPDVTTSSCTDGNVHENLTSGHLDDISRYELKFVICCSSKCMLIAISQASLFKNCISSFIPKRNNFSAYTNIVVICLISLRFVVFAICCVLIWS